MRAIAMMLLVTGVSTSSLEFKWNDFKSKYNKVFNNKEEESAKRDMFLRNLIQAGEHAKPSRHADSSSDQFINNCKETVKKAVANVKAGSYNISMIEKLLPISVDVDVSGWQFSNNGTMPCNNNMNPMVEAVEVISSTSTHWIAKSLLFNDAVRIPKDGKCFHSNNVKDTPSPGPRKFYQRQCDDRNCLDQCLTSGYDLGSCLVTAEGGSLIAVECNAEVGLSVVRYLGTNDCAGFAIQTSQPINSCLPSSVAGDFFVNSCTKPINPNVTLSTPTTQIRTIHL